MEVGEGNAPERPFSLDQEIFVCAHAPYLIKNLRNNFFNKDIQFVYEGRERLARFQHILNFWKLDQGSEIRLCLKWCRVHFDLPRGKNMKVLLACQICAWSFVLS